MIRARRRLRRDRRGSVLVEFALGVPLLIAIITGGIELANYAVTREQVSQLALMVADNASRMGSQDVMTNKPISEGEINDLFGGAELQSGGLDIANNGRIILSSLETNSDGGQWIHWQRCDGRLAHPSGYGKQGDGATGTTVTGMGPPNGRVQARDKVPTMFVEVAYTYAPIMLGSLAPSTEIVETAALTVRDDRDTGGGPGGSGVNPTLGQLPAYCIG